MAIKDIPDDDPPIHEAADIQSERKGLERYMLGEASNERAARHGVGDADLHV